MQGGQSAAQADEQVGIQKQIDAVTRLRDTYRGVADTIGSSFGDAFKGIITGSMTAQEALAGFFQNIGNYFVDMVAKMVAEWAKTQVLRGFQSLLGGLSGMFGGGGSPLSNLNAPGNINNPLGYANGGLVSGGFQAFATGGIVTGPTLGLVGEGRYNEAVIPLPDGRSVPVDLGGMSDGMSGGPITVNVSVDAKGTEVQGDNGQSAALGRAIAASVQAELIKQKRPGGLLAR
jgi:phage-related minor tail protein